MDPGSYRCETVGSCYPFRAPPSFLNIAPSMGSSLASPTHSVGAGPGRATPTKTSHSDIWSSWPYSGRQRSQKNCEYKEPVWQCGRRQDVNHEGSPLRNVMYPRHDPGPCLTRHIGGVESVPDGLKLPAKLHGPLDRDSRRGSAFVAYIPRFHSPPSQRAHPTSSRLGIRRRCPVWSPREPEGGRWRHR